MLITLSRRGLHVAMMWLQLFLYRFYAERIIPDNYNKWESLREPGSDQTQRVDNYIITATSWGHEESGLVWSTTSSPLSGSQDVMWGRPGWSRQTCLDEMSPVCGTDVGVQECSPPPPPPVQCGSVAPQSSAGPPLRHNVNDDQKSKVKPVETLVLDHFSLRYPLLSQYCGS